MDKIIIKGAREHNLKNINVEIPKNKLVVFTGLSGSGKSSLAFDTIYAEGQRRYVESLAAYARQFLGVMDKPDVDSIEGLSPAISIDQKSTSHNPRSTVGTVTEIYDYLRLLFARIGHPHCPKCGREISHQSPQQIVEEIQKLVSRVKGQGSRIILLAPVVKDRKGEFRELFADIAKKGYRQVRVDGQIVEKRKRAIDAVCEVAAGAALPDRPAGQEQPDAALLKHVALDAHDRETGRPRPRGRLVIGVDVQRAHVEPADPAGEPPAGHDGHGTVLIEPDSPAIEEDGHVGVGIVHAAVHRVGVLDEVAARREDDDGFRDQETIAG